MKRYGQVIKVKPEYLEKYKELHANPWPEVNRKIRECNIQNYSIFYLAFLIHYLIVLAAGWIFLKPIYKIYYGINYQLNFQSILFIAVIYLIIWLVIRFMQINDVQRVNYRLKQRQKKNH